MTWLVIGDTHFSDRPKDAYRFGLFDWLAEQQCLHGATATFFLGDLTQEKDNHSSILVNRIVEGLTGLKPPIYIVRGNHDGTDPNKPYFSFVNRLAGCVFAGDPFHGNGGSFYLLPHCRSQQELEVACQGINAGSIIFCHQTFTGAISETGHRLSGMAGAIPQLLNARRIYAGDVHRPQTQGEKPKITYVGAPYSIRFGDDFLPRVLLLEGSQQKDLYYDSPRKLTLRNFSASSDLSRYGLRKGDQVKLEVDLLREQVVNWLSIKRNLLSRLREIGVEVHGITLNSVASTLPKFKGAQHKAPKDLLKAFCEAEEVPTAIKGAGLALLEE